MIYPRISIVTPNFNGARFLEETLGSVIEQGYPNLEYVVIDGGSADNSVEIIRKYEKHLSYWHSKKDSGLYDALNFGFKKTSGEVMGWVNSDDMLHKKSLFTLAELFQLPGVEWVQGMHSWFDEHGRTFKVEYPKLRSRYNYLLKDYHKGSSSFIQQESTYWRRSLWERSGGFISTTYQFAGDFELWMRFFRHGQLFLTNSLVGGFRYTGDGQLSVDRIDEYLKEADQIVSSYELTKDERDNIDFLTSRSLLSKIPFIRRTSYIRRKALLKEFKDVVWDPWLKQFIVK